jgi:cell division protein FtsZ
LGDELRVTVVATGLGNAASAVAQEQVAPVRAVESVTKRSTPDVVTDYKRFDQPAIDRARLKQQEVRRRAVMDTDVNREYLDIPTFLRRQAD